MEKYVRKIADELQRIRKRLERTNDNKVFTVINKEDELIASISLSDDNIICDNDYRVIVSEEE